MSARLELDRPRDRLREQQQEGESAECGDDAERLGQQVEAAWSLAASRSSGVNWKSRPRASRSTSRWKAGTSRDPRRSRTFIALRGAASAIRRPPYRR